MCVIVSKEDGILDPVAVRSCFRAYEDALKAVSPDMQVPDAVRQEIASGIIDLAVRGVRDPAVLQAAGLDRAESTRADEDSSQRARRQG